jgi:uncharacterized membrane protein
MKSFTIKEALEFGWNKTREHSGILFQVMLAFFVLEVVQAIISHSISKTLIGSLASAALSVVGIVMGAGFTTIALKLSANHKVHFGELFPWNRTVWLYFLASVLSGLAMVGGLILLIVPGIFVGVRLILVRFAVMDGARPFESLHVSWNTTRGHFWRMLGLILVLVGINIVGAMLLLVGLLVTVPITVLAMAHVYHKLKHKA